MRLSHKTNQPGRRNTREKEEKKRKKVTRFGNGLFAYPLAQKMMMRKG